MAGGKKTKEQPVKGLVTDLISDLKELQEDFRNIARLSPEGPARMRLLETAEAFDVFSTDAINAARAALPDDIE